MMDALLDLVKDASVQVLALFLFLVAPAVLGLLFSALWGLVKGAMQKGKAKYPKAWRVFEKAVREGVALAEKYGVDDEIDDKLGFAVTFVQSKLDAAGLGKIDVQAIVDAVELEVKRQFNWEELFD